VWHLLVFLHVLPQVARLGFCVVNVEISVLILAEGIQKHISVELRFTSDLLLVCHKLDFDCTIFMGLLPTALLAAATVLATSSAAFLNDLDLVVVSLTPAVATTLSGTFSTGHFSFLTFSEKRKNICFVNHLQHHAPPTLLSRQLLL
jgi:hypothetical protein